MFTGLVEEVGTINNIHKANQGAVILINCSKILDDIKLGDSVAVNGACQTVTRILSDGFEVEASQETLDITTFKDYKKGEKVNLERAMPANGRFGGHIVSGHIDGVGTFKNKINQGLADLYYFEAPDEVAKYIVYKGSITINGISLTIASLEDNTFSISVIPHTVQNTNLIYLKPGDKVNLESDVIAKYIEKLIHKTDNVSEKITVDFLQKHGFMG